MSFCNLFPCDPWSTWAPLLFTPWNSLARSLPFFLPLKRYFPILFAMFKPHTPLLALPFPLVPLFFFFLNFFLSPPFCGVSFPSLEVLGLKQVSAILFFLFFPWPPILRYEASTWVFAPPPLFRLYLFSTQLNPVLSGAPLLSLTILPPEYPLKSSRTSFLSNHPDRSCPQSYNSGFFSLPFPLFSVDAGYSLRLILSLSTKSRLWFFFFFFSLYGNFAGCWIMWKDCIFFLHCLAYPISFFLEEVKLLFTPTFTFLNSPPTPSFLSCKRYRLPMPCLEFCVLFVTAFPSVAIVLCVLSTWKSQI